MRDRDDDGGGRRGGWEGGGDGGRRLVGLNSKGAGGVGRRRGERGYLCRARRCSYGNVVGRAANGRSKALERLPLHKTSSPGIAPSHWTLRTAKRMSPNGLGTAMHFFVVEWVTVTHTYKRRLRRRLHASQLHHVPISATSFPS